MYVTNSRVYNTGRTLKKKPRYMKIVQGSFFKAYTLNSYEKPSITTYLLLFKNSYKYL